MKFGRPVFACDLLILGSKKFGWGFSTLLNFRLPQDNGSWWRCKYRTVGKRVDGFGASSHVQSKERHVKTDSRFVTSIFLNHGRLKISNIFLFIVQFTQLTPVDPIK